MVLAQLFKNLKNELKIFRHTPLKITEGTQTPSNCFLQIVIPMKGSTHIKERFQRFNSNLIRFGRLLEVLDTIVNKCPS